MGWCRFQSIQELLIARLWVLYEKSIVLLLFVALPLITHYLNICDQMQRKMDRMLLCYQKRSPILPIHQPGWKATFRKHQDSLIDIVRNNFLSQTFVYSALLHYPLNMNCRWILGAVNLNRLSSRSLASVVCSHLFAGGQALDILSRINNCFLFYLQKSLKYPEILGYFLFHYLLQEYFLRDVKPYLHRIMDNHQYFTSMWIADLRKLEDAMVASWQIVSKNLGHIS